MWYVAGASVGAHSARRALWLADLNSACLLVDTQRLGWTGVDAWVVAALGAEVRHLEAGERHEDSYHRRLWPYSSLMLKGTGYLAESTSAALRKIPGNPHLSDN